jgi:hypothetical protein
MLANSKFRAFKSKSRFGAKSTLMSIFMFLTSLIALESKAQITITVGTGTTTSSIFPIYTCFGFNYSQQTYLATELVAAGATAGVPGFISSISFDAATMNPSAFAANCKDWMIYMGNTTKSTFSGTTDWVPLSSMSLVYNSTVLPTGTGWFTITLPTPFFWDGTSNLVVAIDENTPNWYCTDQFRMTTRTGTRSISFWSDGTNPNPAAPPTANSTMAGTANIRLNYTPAVACGATVVGGTAVASSTTICPGNSLTLSTTGATGATGLTYQWDSSATGAAPWVAMSATTTAPNFTYVPPTGRTIFYRRRINCTATGATALSSTVSVSVSSPLTVPYNESFETGVAGVNMPCASNSYTWGPSGTLNNWDLKTTPVSFYTWLNNRTPGGNKYLFAGYTISSATTSTSYSTQPEFWFTPAFQLQTGRTYRFSYWYNGSGYSGGSTTLGMSFGNAQTRTAMTNIRPDVAGINTTTYAQLMGDFTVPSDGIYYCGVKVNHNTTFTYPGVVIDDINLQELPACSTATVATFGSGGRASASPNVICAVPGNTTLSLSSTPPFSGLNFQWQMATGSPTLFNDIPGATTATFVNSITAGGIYFFRCNVTCAATGLSSFSDTTRVTTTPITPPYIETFEGAPATTNVPCASHTSIWGGAATYWTIPSAPFSTFYPAIVNRTPGGNRYLFPGYILGTIYLGASQFWFTPALALTAAKAYEVSFWFNGSGYVGGNTVLGVGFGTAQTAAAMTRVGLDTNVNTLTYTQLRRNFIAPATGTYFVGLKVDHTNFNYPGIAIDDIGVNQLPPCSARPVAGTSSAVPAVICTSTGTSTLTLTGTSAASDLSFQWQQSLTGLPGTWSDVVTGIGGTTPGYTTGTPAATMFYRCVVVCPLITGLNSDTSTAIQVRTTPLNIPYIEDFETGVAGVNMPCAAHTASWIASSQWWLREAPFAATIINRTPGGSKYLHAGFSLGASLGGATQYWFTPALNLFAGKSYRVSYWINGVGSVGAATMTHIRAGNAQTAAAMTIFAGPDTVINTSSYINIQRNFTAPSTGIFHVGIGINQLIAFSPGSAIDDIGITQLPSCSARPVAGTANSTPSMLCAAGSTVLRLSGTSAASDLTYQWFDVTAGLPGTPILGATLPSFTTPTLTATRSYRCVVTCPLITGANSDTSSIIVVNVGFITPPYTETFEAATIGVNVPCAAVEGISNWLASSRWWIYGAPFSATYPMIANRTPGGSRYLYAGQQLGSISLGANQFWYTPAMRLIAGTTYEFSYWYNNTSWAGVNTTIGMYYGTAQSAAAMTTAIRPDITGVANTTYRQNIGRFVAPTTGNFFMGIRVNHTATTIPGMAIDDIGLQQLPNCTGAPTVGTVSATPVMLCASGTAVLDMDLGGVTKVAGLTYRWYSSPTSGPLSSGYTPVSGVGAGPTFTTPLLTTTTFFRCVVTCSFTGDSTVSSELKLDVGAVTPPYFQTFESVRPSTNAPCASNTDFWNTSYWWTYGAPLASSPHTMMNRTPGGSNYLSAGFFTGTYGVGRPSYWFTPALRLVAGRLYQFSYWYNGSGYPGGLTDFGAYYGTSNTLAAMTTAIAPDAVGTNTNKYRQFKGQFTAPGTGNYFIGIKVDHKNYTWPGVAIDDIGFEEVPPCSTTVVAGTITCDPERVCAVGGSTNLDLTGTTLASGLTYEWLSSTTAAGPFVTTGATTPPPYATDPLVGDTWFRCVVRCTATGRADTTAPFMVGVGAFPIPYIENFEDDVPRVKPLCSESTEGWGETLLWNIQATAYSTLTNRTPGGSKYLIGGYYLGYFSFTFYGYMTATDNNFWFTPGLALDSRYKYDFSFWYQSSASGNRMGVSYGTAQTVASMTNTLRPFGLVSNAGYVRFDTSFRPARKGTYYIGIQKSVPTAIGTYSFPGMAFDDINLNYSPCDGRPFAGNIMSNSTTSGTALCRGTLISLIDTGATINLVPGIRYQWQRHPSGSSAIWSNIVGATDTILRADTLVGFDYRFAVICTNTGDTAFSTIYSVPALTPHPNVTINPTTTPVTFCVGDSIKFSATSFTGAIYDWMLDSVVIPGWKFSDLGAVDPGTYMVRVRSALSPCPAFSNQVRLIANDPGYKVDITTPSDSIICAGSSVKLTATSSTPGITYQWRRNNVDIPGETSSSYLVTTSGYYRVMAYNGMSACQAASRNILFTVKPNPPAVISVPGGTTTACENEGVQLEANKGAYTYQWSRGGIEIFGWTDSTQIIKNSGIYSVKVRSIDGCVSVSSDVTVNILPSPSPFITKTGLVLNTTAPFASYEWFRNGITMGITTPTLNVTKKGVYKVRVTDFNGCVGESNPIEMMDQQLSISTNIVTDASIKLYPNPTTGNVIIESPIALTVSVKDVLGKTIIAPLETKQIDLKNYADGVYLIILNDKDGNLIKQERVNKISAK